MARRTVMAWMRDNARRDNEQKLRYVAVSLLAALLSALAAWFGLGR